MNRTFDWIVAIIAILLGLNVFVAIAVSLYSNDVSAIWTVLKLESVVPISLLVFAYYWRYRSVATMKRPAIANPDQQAT